MCEFYCDLVNNWLHKPIEWKKERCKLALITCATLAIVGFGLICYWYIGGKYANIPGYNQAYAYFLWSAAGALVVGTTIAFLAKNILSRPKNIHPRTTSPSLYTPQIANHTQPIQPTNHAQPIQPTNHAQPIQPTNHAQPTQVADKSYDFMQLSLQEALKINKGIKWLITEKIAQSIVELTQDEWSLLDERAFGGYNIAVRREALKQILPIFEKKQSSFVAGRRKRCDSWFIAARIHCHTKQDGSSVDGVILVTQNTLDGAKSSWWAFCKIDGLTPGDTQESFREIVFDHPDYPVACKQFLWIKSILEGETRGLIILDLDHKEDENRTISLWQPAQ